MIRFLRSPFRRRRHAEVGLDPLPELPRLSLTCHAGEDCLRRSNAIARIGALRSPRSAIAITPIGHRDHPDRPSRSPQPAHRDHLT
ncbi:MAG: hypothetical protein H6701_17095 [Myxococcales bacterium]|nr:hypothetical protein [Myxococcales bacterium]